MLYRLVRELHGHDGQIHSIITLTDNCSFDFASVGVHIDLLDLKKAVNPLWGLVKLREMIRKHNPDVIQAWMYHGNLASTISSPPGIPVVWSIHHSLHDLKHEKLSIRLLIKTGAFLSRSKNTRRIVYCSENSKNQHCDHGYPLEKAIIIPNGFDCVEFSPDEAARLSTRRALGFDEDHLLIGNFGRYHPVKDHEILLRAFAEVSVDVPMARIVLAGSGITDTNPDLVNLIRRLGIANRIVLLGPRNDMPKLYNALDLYALSSKSEAFPNVLGEASACGVPSITTDVGDASRIIGDTGSVVSPGSVDLLRGALRQMLMLDRCERITLGNRARQHVVDSFALPVVASAYSDLYNNLTTEFEI